MSLNIVKRKLESEEEHSAKKKVVNLENKLKGLQSVIDRETLKASYLENNRFVKYNIEDLPKNKKLIASIKAPKKSNASKYYIDCTQTVSIHKRLEELFELYLYYRLKILFGVDFAKHYESYHNKLSGDRTSFFKIDAKSENKDSVNFARNESGFAFSINKDAIKEFAKSTVKLCDYYTRCTTVIIDEIDDITENYDSKVNDKIFKKDIEYPYTFNTIEQPETFNKCIFNIKRFKNKIMCFNISKYWEETTDAWRYSNNIRIAAEDYIVFLSGVLDCDENNFGVVYKNTLQLEIDTFTFDNLKIFEYVHLLSDDNQGYADDKIKLEILALLDKMFSQLDLIFHIAFRTDEVKEALSSAELVIEKHLISSVLLALSCSDSKEIIFLNNFDFTNILFQ